jgi:hypothetical protein
MLGVEYLQQVLTNLYKEHTEKFINDKADALRDETLAEIRKE